MNENIDKNSNLAKELPNLKILGEFRVAELEKNYIIGTLVNDNPMGNVILMEFVLDENGNRHLKDIPLEETDLVTFVYRNLVDEMVKEGEK